MLAVQAPPAPALLTLRCQLEAIAPHRRPNYYGIVGDRAHLLRRSKHNAGEAIDVPTVLLGLYQANHMCERLRWEAAAGSEPRLERLIWARRSCSARTGWQWVRYVGLDRHELHFHLECSHQLREDQRLWLLS